MQTILGSTGSIGKLLAKDLIEFNEMSYQWESEYFLDSSKFENEFNFKTTSYSKGIDSYFN
jgi:hypothetical protein